MFFSRVRLAPMITDIKKVTQAIQGSVYREHQIIWNLFENAEDTKRDFLYRRFDQGTTPQFFVLSQRSPKNDTGIWSIETNEYAPVVKKGNQFSFNLRVNPVVTKKIEGAKNPKSRKHDDIVMEARAKYTKSGKTIPSNNEIIMEAGLKWMKERAKNYGFSVNESKVIIDGYTQLTGKKDRAGHAIRLGVMDFSGILEITDVTQFTQTLYQGIGRAKAFGCGLLLLKRV